MNEPKPSLIPPRNPTPFKTFYAVALGGAILTFLLPWHLYKANTTDPAQISLNIMFYLACACAPIITIYMAFKRGAITRNERDREDAAIYMFTQQPPKNIESVFLVSSRQRGNHFAVFEKTIADGDNVYVVRYPEGRSGERFAPELLAYILRQLPDKHRVLIYTTESLIAVGATLALLKKDGVPCSAYHAVPVEPVLIMPDDHTTGLLN